MNPPNTPIQVDGKNISYFQLLYLQVNPILMKDNITLSFQGYNQTIQEYEKLKETDTENAWKLAKELNAWTEYFSSVSNLIQKMYLDSETDKIAFFATASLKADAVKVANGERMANCNEDVIKARKKRNILKAFNDELVEKMKFLERAHYHCKATYDWANKQKQASQQAQ